MCNKIADKMTRTNSKELHLQNKNEYQNLIPKERYISPEEKQQIIDELRLTKYNNVTSKNSKLVK